MQPNSSSRRKPSKKASQRSSTTSGRQNTKTTSKNEALYLEDSIYTEYDKLCTLHSSNRWTIIPTPNGLTTRCRHGACAAIHKVLPQRTTQPHSHPHSHSHSHSRPESQSQSRSREQPQSQSKRLTVTAQVTVKEKVTFTLAHHNYGHVFSTHASPDANRSGPKLKQELAEQTPTSTRAMVCGRSPDHEQRCSGPSNHGKQTAFELSLGPPCATRVRHL